MLKIYDADLDLINKIEKVYRRALRELSQRDIFTVEVSFVNNREIKKLNKSSRGIDKVTDVLSFQNLSDLNIASSIRKRDFPYDIDPESGKIILGEIVIADAVMRSQAVEYGHSVERECCYLFLHGLLHLFGFDHVEDEGRAAMREAEEDILSSLKIMRK